MNFHRAHALGLLLVPLAGGCASRASTGATETASAAATSEGAQTSSSAKTLENVPADSARPAHWGYAGAEDPAHWAQLSDAYTACAQDGAQSPIDLPPSAPPAQDALAVAYGKSGLTISHNEHVHDLQDNGHTIQVTVDEGSTLRTAKDTYSLLQFHFHTPSENTVEGKHYPMEAHFVHQAEDGRFAVIAVFFEEGTADPNLATLIEHFPGKGETKVEESHSLDLSLHLPPVENVYAFTGSFTTPPCTPDVEWFVVQQPASASSEQLAAFAARLNHNNRPTQPLNGREISLARLPERADP